MDLSLDVVLAHGPQLLVKLGGDLVGAEVLHSLKDTAGNQRAGARQPARRGRGFFWGARRYLVELLQVVLDGRAVLNGLHRLLQLLPGLLRVVLGQFGFIWEQKQEKGDAAAFLQHLFFAFSAALADF